jgi:hypothetical protein
MTITLTTIGSRGVTIAKPPALVDAEGGVELHFAGMHHDERIT